VEELEELNKAIKELREDINLLAMYFKKITQKNDETFDSINKDLKSIEKDIANKMQEIVRKANSTVVKNDVTYIQNLIKDDFKEMQTNLLNQIAQIINTLRGENKK